MTPRGMTQSRGVVAPSTTCPELPGARRRPPRTRAKSGELLPRFSYERGDGKAGSSLTPRPLMKMGRQAPGGSLLRGGGGHDPQLEVMAFPKALT